MTYNNTSVQRQKGLTGYCFNYIDRPFCLQTNEHCLFTDLDSFEVKEESVYGFDLVTVIGLHKFRVAMNFHMYCHLVAEIRTKEVPKQISCDLVSVSDFLLCKSVHSGSHT